MFGNKSIVLCFSANPAVTERKVYKINNWEGWNKLRGLKII